MFFENKEPTYQETLLFALKKWERVNEYLKKTLLIWLIAGRKPATLGLPKRGLIRRMYCASHQRFCRHEVCESVAISQYEKKLRLLKWMFSFWKNFRQKNFKLTEKLVNSLNKATWNFSILMFITKGKSLSQYVDFLSPLLCQFHVNMNIFHDKY